MSLVRKMAAVTAALVTGGGLVAFGGTSAQAADPDCTITAPAQLKIAARTNPVPLSVTCSRRGVDQASWTVSSGTFRKGVVNSQPAKGVGPSSLVIYDNNPRGRWDYTPSQCVRAQGSCTQNTTATDVRLWGWGGITKTSRSGSTVSITTSSQRWAYTLHKLVPWTTVFGTIQWSEPGANTWHNLKYVYPDRTGHFTYTYGSPATRDYRLVQATSGQVWGSTSTTVRR